MNQFTSAVQAKQAPPPPPHTPQTSELYQSKVGAIKSPVAGDPEAAAQTPSPSLSSPVVLGFSFQGPMALSDLMRASELLDFVVRSKPGLGQAEEVGSFNDSGCSANAGICHAFS